jgi:hypothetical protein
MRSEEQIQALEASIDELLKNSMEPVKFDSRYYKNREEWLNDLVEYYAWKDLYLIKPELDAISNPNKRFIQLMKFGFRNIRYSKLFIVLNQMVLPDKARKVIQDVIFAKEKFVIRFFTDKGYSESLGREQFKRIQPAFYGYIADKNDVMESDTQKADMFGFLTRFLFPQFYKEKVA